MLRPWLILRSLPLTFAAIVLVTTTQAQDDDPKPPTPVPVVIDAPADSEPARTFPPYRRVPSQFGKVGLSNQQKEDIYIIRSRYQSEITELKARIESLARQEMTECEAILTEAQRKLLDQIRAASRPPQLGSGN